MTKQLTIRLSRDFLQRVLLALLLIGLLTTRGSSQTNQSVSLRLRVVDAQGNVFQGATVVLETGDADQSISRVTTSDGTVTFVNLQPGTKRVIVTGLGFVTLAQTVTVSANHSESLDLSIEPIETAVKPSPAACGDVPCIREKINSLKLGFPRKFARGLQYQYQLNEQPGSLLVASGAVILKNPEKYLQQHTLALKFVELFPERLSMFKRGSEYLKTHPQAGNELLSDVLCPNHPLITCLTKGGSWWQRMLMGTSVSVSTYERAAVQNGFIVTSPQFGKHYQVNGGFTFDPAKLFPTATNWKSTFDEVQRTDNKTGKAVAFLGASDVASGEHPWNHKFATVFIPKVEFKILSQFDFVKYGGVLIQAPFPERSLNTWTFSWDLTRVIPDTKAHLDADAIQEALKVLKNSLGRPEPPPPKQCVVSSSSEERKVDVPPDFSAASCEKLKALLNAKTP